MTDHKQLLQMTAKNFLKYANRRAIIKGDIIFHPVKINKGANLARPNRKGRSSPMLNGGGRI